MSSPKKAALRVVGTAAGAGSRGQHRSVRGRENEELAAPAPPTNPPRISIRIEKRLNLLRTFK